MKRAVLATIISWAVLSSIRLTAQDFDYSSGGKNSGALVSGRVEYADPREGSELKRLERTIEEEADPILRGDYHHLREVPKDRRRAFLYIRDKMLRHFLALARTRMLELRTADMSEESAGFHRGLSHLLKGVECFIPNNVREHGRESYIKNLLAIALCFESEFRAARWEFNSSISDLKSLYQSDRQSWRLLINFQTAYDQRYRAVGRMGALGVDKLADRAALSDEDVKHLLEKPILRELFDLIDDIRFSFEERELPPGVEIFEDTEKFDLYLEAPRILLESFAQDGGPSVNEAKIKEDVEWLISEAYSLIDLARIEAAESAGRLE